MARPLRYDYPFALHHVISRGDNRRKIVWDDQDRSKRLAWLARTVEQQGWVLHAFCLMTNHEHLLVETPLANLAPGMKLLNGAYTQYINARYRRCGHLFQGRYKAHLVEQDGHFGELSRYIHLNPCRAGMVEDPGDYAWSSFPGYVRSSKQYDWLTYKRVLDRFGPGAALLRRRRYASFVRAGVETPPPCPWKSLKNGLVIGSDGFAQRVKKEMGLLEPVAGVMGSVAMVDRPALEEVLTAAAAELEADRGLWSAGRRVDGADRALAAVLCRRGFRYSATEVAAALGYRGSSGVSNAVKRVEASVSLTRAYGKLLRAVEREVGLNDK